MAIKAQIYWEVFDKSNNERVEGVSQTTFVNSYDEIQPKMLEKLSQNYQAKALEKDLKLQDKLSPSGDRGGYTLVEFTDDPKEHDIIVYCSILSHG